MPWAWPNQDTQATNLKIGGRESVELKRGNETLSGTQIETLQLLMDAEAAAERDRLGAADLATGDLEAAEAALLEAKELAKSISNPRRAAHANHHLGELAGVVVGVAPLDRHEDMDPARAARLRVAREAERDKGSFDEEGHLNGLGETNVG